MQWERCLKFLSVLWNLTLSILKCVIPIFDCRGHGPDGQIASVSFYSNGELVGEDTSSPYSVVVELNATGHFEFYAVARDNMGNITTSNVRRVVMDEESEVSEPVLVITSPNAYKGGLSEFSATFKSKTGVYDVSIRALVYIDGTYIGDADLLPRTIPAPGEEDPGQGFTFDLSAQSVGTHEVEFVIINGDETSQPCSII